MGQTKVTQSELCSVLNRLGVFLWDRPTAKRTLLCPQLIGSHHKSTRTVRKSSTVAVVMRPLSILTRVACPTTPADSACPSEVI